MTLLRLLSTVVSHAEEDDMDRWETEEDRRDAAAGAATAEALAEADGRLAASQDRLHRSRYDPAYRLKLATEELAESEADLAAAVDNERDIVARAEAGRLALASALTEAGGEFAALVGLTHDPDRFVIAWRALVRVKHEDPAMGAVGVLFHNLAVFVDGAARAASVLRAAQAEQVAAKDRLATLERDS